MSNKHDAAYHDGRDLDEHLRELREERRSTLRPIRVEALGEGEHERGLYQVTLSLNNQGTSASMTMNPRELADLRDRIDALLASPAADKHLDVLRDATWREGAQAMVTYQQGARHKVPYPVSPYRPAPTEVPNG